MSSIRPDDRRHHQRDATGALDRTEVGLAGGERLAAHTLRVVGLAADDDDERFHAVSVSPTCRTSSS